MELNTYNLDYFIIFAHVDNDSGLLKECGGGLITSLFQKDIIRERDDEIEQLNRDLRAEKFYRLELEDKIHNLEE